MIDFIPPDEGSNLTRCLDFADFFEFNHTLEPRPPLDTAEAIRIIIMEIRATKIEAPSKEDDPTFPVVHFSGISHLTFDQGDPNINSSIQGFYLILPFYLNHIASFSG